MSDLDAFEFGEPTPAPEPQPAPQPEPTIDPAEVQRLQQRVEQAERFQQALQATLTGTQPQNPQYAQQAYLEQLAQNPQEVIAREAARAAQAQVQAFQLEQEYAAKFPHLVPVKDAVIAEAYQLAEQAARAGKPLSDRDAIEQAAKAWDAKLDALYAAKTQQAQAAALKQAALPFTVPSAGQGLPSAAPNLSQMSNAEFAAYRAQYLRSRGISA